MVIRQTDGDSHALQVHPDHRKPDIESPVSLDLHHGDRVLEMIESIRREGAAGMQPGDDRHFLIAALLCFAALHDERPIQMLAALESQSKSLLLCSFHQSRHNSRADFIGAVLADVSAADLARRTTDDDEASFSEMGNFAKLMESFYCLFL